MTETKELKNGIEEGVVTALALIIKLWCIALLVEH